MEITSTYGVTSWSSALQLGIEVLGLKLLIDLRDLKVHLLSTQHAGVDEQLGILLGGGRMVPHLLLRQGLGQRGVFHLIPTDL